MIFKHTLAEVVSGKKTRTTRPFKDGVFSVVASPGEEVIAIDEIIGGAGKHGKKIANSSFSPIAPPVKTRRKYRVGGKISVQPGRGHSSVATVLVTRIKVQKLNEITDKDIATEAVGNGSREEFFELWDKMHKGKYSSANNPTVVALYFELLEIDYFELTRHWSEGFKDFLLASIGLTRDDVMRFRDVYVSYGRHLQYYSKKNPLIVIEARVGAGNRPDYEEEIEEMVKKAGGLHEEEDVGDPTYVYFYRRLPENLLPRAAELVNGEWVEHVEKWGIKCYL
jgi:hypothetical protein